MQTHYAYHSSWTQNSVGRHDGFMVSALVFGSSGPGSSLGRDTGLCSWARHFNQTVPLSTQLHKWVPCDGPASHPGASHPILVASCNRNRAKLGPNWPLGLNADFQRPNLTLVKFGRLCFQLACAFIIPLVGGKGGGWSLCTSPSFSKCCHALKRLFT